MTDQIYRVWVEKHESGWIPVTAPSEEIARDRAQALAARRDGWSPESTSITPLAVYPVMDVTGGPS